MKKNNIFYSILFINILIFSSTSYANNTIKIIGNIVEETCSISKSDKECITLSKIKLSLKNKNELIAYNKKFETKIEIIDLNKKILLINYN